jgi:hypothetical protein
MREMGRVSAPEWPTRVRGRGPLAQDDDFESFRGDVRLCTRTFIAP